MQIHGASVHGLQSLHCITDGEKLDAGRYLRVCVRACANTHARTRTHGINLDAGIVRARRKALADWLTALTHGFMVLIRLCRSQCLVSQPVSCLRLAMACRCVFLFLFVCVCMCVYLFVRACVMCVVVYALCVRRFTALSDIPAHLCPHTSNSDPLMMDATQVKMRNNKQLNERLKNQVCSSTFAVCPRLSVSFPLIPSLSPLHDLFEPDSRVSSVCNHVAAMRIATKDFGLYSKSCYVIPIFGPSPAFDLDLMTDCAEALSSPAWQIPSVFLAGHLMLISCSLRSLCEALRRFNRKRQGVFHNIGALGITGFHPVSRDVARDEPCGRWQTLSM